VGPIAAWYNFARFGSIFELGLRYQLNGRNNMLIAPCGLCTFPELLRFVNHSMHYLFWPPIAFSRFPYVDLQPSRLDYAVSYPSAEQVGGVAPLMPLVIVATLFAAILVVSRRADGAAIRASALTLGAGWLILAGLAGCVGIAPRFPLDFVILMAIGSVVCVEAGTAVLHDAGVPRWALRAAVIGLACYSIILGLALGFAGPERGFARLNPELFQRLGGALP
jgi:hypothetical protein